MILYFDFINFISFLCVHVCVCRCSFFSFRCAHIYFCCCYPIFIFAQPALFPFRFDSLQMKINMNVNAKKKNDEKSANHIKYFAMKNSSVAECAPADLNRFQYQRDGSSHISLHRTYPYRIAAVFLLFKGIRDGPFFMMIFVGVRRLGDLEDLLAFIRYLYGNFFYVRSFVCWIKNSIFFYCCFRINLPMPNSYGYGSESTIPFSFFLCFVLLFLWCN